MGKVEVVDKITSFDRKGQCPIDKRSFSDCLHSYGEVINYLNAKQQDQHLRKVIRSVLREEGLIQ